MKSIWDTHAQREIHDRLATLAADRPRRWGKMTAQQMVCHLNESLRMALGDLKVLTTRHKKCDAEQTALDACMK